jgi:very-short-patch-repair endonuclease
MVAAPNERIGSLTTQSHQRKFNVAASRAQDQMWLFHTVTQNDLSQSCLRRKLLEYFEEPNVTQFPGIDEDINALQIQAQTANRQIEKAPDPFDSWFELDVALHIASRGFRVVPQYPVINDMFIDLVVEGNESKLAVECDGDYWHGAERYDSDMERQRMLERCGWHFHRIRECSFYANPEKELEKLWKVLESMTILPVKKASEKEEIEKNGDEEIDPQLPKQAVLDFYNHEKSQEPDNPIPSQKANTDQREKGVFQPGNIQEALSMKPAHLRSTIIDVLKTRPNNSCVKDALPRFILGKLRILSRGNPRKQFCCKVNNSLKYLERESVIRIYKSKNMRVRLV